VQYYKHPSQGCLPGTQLHANLEALEPYYEVWFKQLPGQGRVSDTSLGRKLATGQCLTGGQLLSIVDGSITTAEPALSLPAGQWTVLTAWQVQQACLLLQTFGYQASPRPGTLMDMVLSTSPNKCSWRLKGERQGQPQCHDDTCSGNTIDAKSDGSVVVANRHHKNWNRCAELASERV